MSARSPPRRSDAAIRREEEREFERQRLKQERQRLI